MIICAACAEENPERAKFCLNCATPLQPTEPQRQQRKTVTVLFSDLIGSTALGEQLDPESLRAVMGRYFAAMKPTIEHHGGTVEKFIGDAIMAVFGVPVVHEDDALRAVRAAVGMSEDLERLNRELETERGIRIAIRTGVNTGEVVAGDQSAGQTLVTGDAVNVAARLEQAAGAGEILLGQSTYRLVRKAVEAELFDALELKGKSSPVTAYRLRALRADAEAHPRRLSSPLVGRASELERLRSVYEQAVRDRSSQLFTLLGPAGVGKSRLVTEFLASLPGDAQLLRGRCLPYGEGITYWPVGEVLKQAATVHEADEAHVARAKLDALVGGERDGPLVAARLASAIGLSAEPAPQEEIFWAVRKLLEVLARRAPLVVVWDDIHWAEPTFLDVVEHLADWSRNAPLLILCIARPELLDGRPNWGGGKLNATTVLLEPLPPEAAERLIDSLPGGAALDEPTRRRIADAAEGNPLFVEEMLGMLVDDGFVIRTNDGWQPVRDLNRLHVPPSVSALLAARLDRLASGERTVAERAAVVGRVFERSAVSELTPEPLRPEITIHLLGLVRKELVRPDEPGLTGDDAFRFRHILIRDAAYESVPKSERAELHERFADWLERVAADRAAEYEEIVGYHLDQAYRYRLELAPPDEHATQLATRAAGLLDSAGQRALARGDDPAAIDLLGRAAQLLPENDGRRLELLVQLAESTFTVGDLSKARAIVEQVHDDALRANDERMAAIATVLRAQLKIATDPAARTLEMEQALAAAEPILAGGEDPFGLARLLDCRLDLRMIQCRWSEARAIAAEAHELAVSVGDSQRVTAMARALLNAMHWGPTPASEALQQAERLRAELGDRGGGRGLGEMLAPLYAMQGRFADARAAYTDAQSYYEELGTAVRLAFLGLRAWDTERIAGDHEAALRVAQTGLDRTGALGETGVRSTLAGMLAESLYQLERFQEAAEASRLAEELGSTDDMATQILWRTARAKTSARTGDWEAAQQLARQALDIAQATDFLVLQAVAYVALGEVERLAGDRQAAIAALERALECFESKEDLPDAQRLRAQIKALMAET